jgi:hypothetical protein
MLKHVACNAALCHDSYALIIEMLVEMLVGMLVAGMYNELHLLCGTANASYFVHT